MIRNLLFLTGITCLAMSQADAQKTSRRPPFGTHKLDPVTQHILQQQLPKPSQRGTVLADRLIGYSFTYDQTVDSARFKYNSDARGSNLDNNVLSTYMDVPVDYTYEQLPYPLAIDRSNPSLKFDTAFLVYTEEDTIRNNSLLTRSYAADRVSTEVSRTDDYYNGLHYLEHKRADFTYDAAGNLVTAQGYNDTSAGLTGSFEPVTFWYYNYVSGRIARDSSVGINSGNAQPEYNVNYTYNSAGKLVQLVSRYFNGSTYVNSAEENYTYLNGKLSTHLGRRYDNGTWINSNADTFTYQGNNLTYNSSYTWDPNTGTWIYGNVTNSYYNVSGNLDSQLVSVTLAGSPLQLSSKLTYTYTSFNHFNRLAQYIYNGSGFDPVPDAQAVFFYETYNATAIKNTASRTSNTISIYPNPATDVLNIRFKETPKSPVTVRVYNAAGQLLQFSAVNAASAVQVLVGTLAPGTYFVEAGDNAGTQRQMFVKF